MSIDFAELLVQVLQLPIIAFIFSLCLSAKNTLNIRRLLWIGVAFIVNFIYIATSILTHDAFIYEMSLNPITKYNFILYSRLLDNFSFVFFSVPLFNYLFKKVFQRNLSIKLWLAENKTKKVINGGLLFVLSVFSIIISYTTQGLLVRFLLGLFKAACLVYLVSFFKETKYTSKWSTIFLTLGFYSWAFLQFAVVVTIDSNYYNLMNSIGFSISFISKIFIFIGIIMIVLNVEKKKAETITEVNIRKEELKKSSEIFENIIKNTFHEITFPLNSLGSDLARLSGYINRDHRARFRDLELNFERVKAIIAVAKSSYKPEVLNVEEFENTEITSLKSISVNYLIEKAINSIKNSYQKINVEHNYSSNVLVKCNQTEIIQVLTNLIKNAIEAYDNESEKRIILKSYNQKKESFDNEKSVLVEIEDFASGIEASNIERIWERGFSTKEITEKTLVRGEGLYVVLSLCNRNNVKIEVQSPVKTDNSHDLHNGTKFTLYFNKNKS